MCERAVSVGLLLGLAFGCDPSASKGLNVDAGAVPDAEAAPFVAEPTAPSRPLMEPCAVGWTARDVEGTVVCVPPPLASVCERGSFDLLDGRGCQVIQGCPVGDYAEPAVGTRAIYVSRRKPSGAPDGSLASPFDNLQDAVDAVGDDSVTILVGKGTFIGSALVDKPTHIIGACPAETVLTDATASSSRAVLTILGATVSASGFSIVDAARPALAASDGHLQLESVEVKGATTAGLLALDGATVSGTRVSIRNTHGYGLYLDEGAEATFTHCSLDENLDNAVLVTGAGTRLTLSDSVVTRTLQRSGRGGQGLQAQVGGVALLERVVLAANHDAGIMVITDDDSDGTHVTLTDVAIVDTEVRAADLKGGHGLYVQDGAALTGTRVLLSGNHEVSLMLSAAVASMTDLVILDSLPGGVSTSQGAGIFVREGAELTLSRALVRDATAFGIGVTDADSRLAATDVVVRDVAEDYFAHDLGRAVEVGSGAFCSLERAGLSNTHEAGLKALGSDITLHLTDVRVDTVLGSVANGEFGRGLDLGGGVVATLERVAISNAGDVGLFVVGDNTEVTASDCSVRDTQGERGSGMEGRAVAVQRRSMLSVNGLDVVDARSVGISVVDGAHMEAQRLRMRGVAACSGSACADEPAGHGVLVSGQSSASFADFDMADIDACAVVLAEQSELDLQEGRVANARAGVCVQVDGYDLARLTEAVAYENVDTPISTESVALPDVLIETRF